MSDPTARVLHLLSLLQTHRFWPGGELARRLEVSDRTLRRDVERLRELGYPVDATPGVAGGYRLGAGAHLPPLLLDDDEAVAVAVALQNVSRSADPMLGEPAVAALAKLSQVLPSGLRERVDTLGAVLVHAGRPPGRSGPAPDVDVLMRLAHACRARDGVRFDYQRGDGTASRRHVEPHRLVSLKNRWYLVAFDVDRDDWRTFRIDRITAPQATGAKAHERPTPDAAALVAEGVAVRVYETSARVRLPVPPGEAVYEISPAVGVIETTDEQARSTVVRIGGDLDWIARYVTSLPYPVEVLDPPELRTELRRLAHRILRTHPPAGP
jgi:predicted DNA-binding transcriptional regulator YafY